MKERLWERKLDHDSLLSTRDLSAYLIQNFAYKTRPKYLEQVLTDLEDKPHRALNPHYLRFFARISLMSAEYGFPESSGHVFRHEQTSSQLDYLHPRHLLELANYMAHINVQAFAKKREILDWWFQKEGKFDTRIHQIMGRWTRPHGGVVEFPAPGKIFKSGDIEVHSERISRDLPLILPDIEFHQHVLATNFTWVDAESMLQDEFVTSVLPVAQAAFPWIDLNSIFLNPHEEVIHTPGV